MFRESRIYLTFLLLVLIPPVSAAPLPPIYIAIVAVILFIVLVAIAARIADRYHMWESFKKPGHQGYPEDDGRYEMKVFKGHGFGNDDEAPTPVMYEKRKHKKRGLTYQELAEEAGTVASEQKSQTPVEKPGKPPKMSKKERREEKERRLREELHRSISKDEKISGRFLADDESALSPRQPSAVTSPRDKRAMSPPPPPNPRTDIPTSPSQKRPLSPPLPRGFEDPPPTQPPPRTKTPLSPKRRAKTPLSPQTPQRNPPRDAHNTLPANSSNQAESSEPATTPTGYHYPTLPGGYFPPHPGGYPPVPPTPAYPAYPYPHPGVPAYPGYPPQSATPVNTTPPPVPVPVQPAAYHMAYPAYPQPGYYPPHPGYPPAAPGVSQSKHQSQL